jgi:UDP-glucose:(heptosyl)LPS alpha-1,3-glucosyltransferase
VHAAWLERRAAFEPRWRRLFRMLRPKHRELLALERHLFSTRGAAAVIANSRMVRDEITARFDRRADDIHVIYNGVPPFVANPGARRRIRASLSLGESSYVVLFVGSGWERKGLRFAVEAVDRFRDPECVLLVAGTGRLPSVRPSAQVRFVGATEKTSELLAAADVFLLPTIYDPFSNACLEAMAAGLPVITTRSNGFSEVIEEGIEGDVLDDPREIGAMARCLEAWKSSPRRETVRARLREKSAHFSTEENMRKTLDVIAAARTVR